MMKTDLEIAEITLEKMNEYYDQMDEEVNSHLHYMILELEDIAANHDDTRKVNRWLGFIHGTLVALTDCTVEELRNAIR